MRCGEDRRICVARGDAMYCVGHRCMCVEGKQAERTTLGAIDTERGIEKVDLDGGNEMT